jgi:peptidoglycan/xylan/chitin deacetylase (PgdA/CDA1 family)
MVLYPDRRSLLAGFCALGLTAGCATRKLGSDPSTPGIAITVDDFDLSDTVLMSGADRDTAIRASLRHHGVKAAGFVAGKYVEATVSPRVLARWSNDGHIIGNHSFSHRYFGGENPDALMVDILRCEPLLSGYSGFRRLFRFPYLAEGKTAAGRDAMRVLLKEHGYRNAPVTIDTSDWYIDNRLKTRLQSDPRSALGPYRRFYLDHVWERATFYDGLARSLFGRSIDHTILLHHRLATGLFLDDLLTMFSARGWRLVDAEAAFASPVLALEPNALPAGQSLVWAAAKADGRFDTLLRFPGEDGDYEAPKMDALGL